MTRDYQFHSLPQPQKFGRLALIQRVTLHPPGAVIAIPSYSIFQVATPTIPNAKIDLAGLRGMIDSVGRFEGSVPGDRWRSQRESDLAASGYEPPHVRPF